MPTLIVERGREKGQTFELQPTAACVVGRDAASAQVVIADAAASRRHFQLSFRGGKWYVADLGSKNATFVNEEKIEKEVELAPGDRIQVGETVFTFNDDPKSEDKSAGLQGKEIGGYKILERIGRGGMGTVFKAKQVSLNRLVALKFLSPKLSKDPSFVAKFFAEARAAAQLNHPNVVQVFDVGTLSGVHFFSMEFMEGGCVMDLLSAREDSRLTWQEAMPVILDAVRGLVFAEKRGIIHRDIKPDNLMLTSEQKVKIGDLGLATSAEGEKEKGIFGTPHFIAPEQAQGREVTHAADLYSLGATFYRMVCGRTPFSGTTVKEILRAQINDPHVPVVQVVPDFPPELSAIIDKLMAKKVEERYQSATKLLEDLEAFQLAHQIELAGGVRSKKPFLIAVGVLVLALAAVLIWISVQEPEIVTNTVRERSVIEVGPKGPVKTPEDIQREHDIAAQLDFGELEKRDLKLGEISLEKAAEWDQLQKDYDALSGRHPNARLWIPNAEKRAKDIRIKLQDLKTFQETVVKTAKDWWAKTEGELKATTGELRWGDAIRRAEAVRGSEEWKTHLPHLPPDTQRWLDGIPDDALKAATLRNAEVFRDADKLLEEGRVSEALAAAQAWETQLREQNLHEGDPRWALLADQAKQWREQKAAQMRAKLEEQLGLDKVAFLSAWRSVRNLRDGGPVFVLKFGDAAQQLRTAVHNIVRTGLYKERAEQTAARLDAVGAAWAAWSAMLAEGKLWGAGENLTGFPGVAQGARVALDPERPATQAEVYTIVSVGSGPGGGSTKKTFQWEDLTPTELYRIVVGPKVDKLPPDLQLQLGEMFALLKETDAAAELLEKTRAQFTPDRTAWLAAETSALQEHDRLMQGAGVAPAELMRYCDQWRRQHFRTDAFILLDGRTPEATPHLWSDEELRRFVESFGEKK